MTGQEYRGAIQTGSFRYVAEFDGRLVGYIDCGTYDRYTEYQGEGAAGPIIVDSIEAPAGALAFVVDPARRGRGIGRAMIGALMLQPQVAFVALFEAGVEPENLASRRCLAAAGFTLRSEEPDFEGFLYYLVRRDGGALGRW